MYRLRIAIVYNRLAKYSTEVPLIGGTTRMSWVRHCCEVSSV